ncbi:MAG: alpha/beta hydrolase, partial [Flavobacteriaceae bacterium]|nr:alpha/beta hydrolase [Flavobacteriaceae bacterium]
MKPTLSLVFLIIISSFLASIVQTNFNKTHIETKKLFTIDDQFIVYDLYKPKLASKDNKLPYVVIVPGFQRSKEA